MNIPEFTKKYNKAKATYERLCEEAGAYWMGEADKITTELDARKLLDECPDHITRVFMIDMFLTKGIIQRKESK